MFRQQMSRQQTSRNQSELFDDYLWLVQLQQARCYETGLSQWRRLRSKPANTMGVLYWQLNDVWQGPSWSTIELDGTLKLAHFAVGRAFEPLLLSARDAHSGSPASSLEVHLSSDHQVNISGTLHVQIIRWLDSPAVPAAEATAQVTALALGSSCVWSAPIAPLLARARVNRTAAFVRLMFEPEINSPVKRLEAFHWLTVLKDAALPLVAVHVVAVTIDSAEHATVQLHSIATAAFVSLESHHVAGAFSDGAFTLLAGVTRKIDFTARHADEKQWATFESGLRIRSLRDTYS